MQAFMRMDENLTRFNSLFAGDGPNRLFVYFQAAERAEEVSSSWLIRHHTIKGVPTASFPSQQNLGLKGATQADFGPIDSIIAIGAYVCQPC